MLERNVRCYLLLWKPLTKIGHHLRELHGWNETAIIDHKMDKPKISTNIATKIWLQVRTIFYVKYPPDILDIYILHLQYPWWYGGKVVRLDNLIFWAGIDIEESEVVDTIYCPNVHGLYFVRIECILCVCVRAVINHYCCVVPSASDVVVCLLSLKCRVHYIQEIYKELELKLLI